MDSNRIDNNIPELLVARGRAVSEPAGVPWKILVVDDEEEVHAVTSLVLNDFEYKGRRVELISAFSATAAKEILRTNDDIAIVLLDVVMETDDAGLKLVQYIRETLKNPLARIVIRTGQPGHAPETKVVLDYDINDYSEKVELTSRKLVTIIVSALRTYQDLALLEHHSRELNKMNVEFSQMQNKIKDTNINLERKISELEQTRQALKKNEDWLTTTLKSVGDGVIATDVSNQIMLMNPVACQLTGWALLDAVGKHLDDVFQLFDEGTALPMSNFHSRLKKNQTPPNSGILLAKNDKKRFVAFSHSPIVDDQKVNQGQVFVFRDVSDQRKMESMLRQQQKLESLGTLASGIAHEIKNPLTAILNYAELLHRKLDDNTDQHALSKEIVFEAERVTKIIKSMLAFARQEMDEEPVKPTQMSDVLESVLPLIRATIMKDEITLHIDIPDDLPAIDCRGQQIGQVVTNLVTNARDALNQRYPTANTNKVIKITSHPIMRNGNQWIRTTVEDHSLGIRTSTIPRIFDPFFTTKPSGVGTGLGLSVSHGIVTDHGGELTVESEEGKFTRFHIDLRASTRE
jgi:PAS domain S-box-containing protein